MTPKNDWNNDVKVHVRTCSIDSLYMYFDTVLDTILCDTVLVIDLQNYNKDLTECFLKF
jgi:hypothetical protein